MIEELVEAARREPASGRLAALLRRLHDVVAEHLDAEERDVLPLAALHLTEAEWAAIGENGATAVPRTKLPLLFGMFLYDGDPDVVRDMLSSAPPVIRALLPRIAPRAYARYCRRVHGTPNPNPTRSEPTMTSTSIATDLTDLNRQWGEAFNAGDLPRLMEFYEPDAVLVPGPDAEPVWGEPMILDRSS